MNCLVNQFLIQGYQVTCRLSPLQIATESLVQTSVCPCASLEDAFLEVELWVRCHARSRLCSATIFNGCMNAGVINSPRRVDVEVVPVCLSHKQRHNGHLCAAVFVRRSSWLVGNSQASEGRATGSAEHRRLARRGRGSPRACGLDGDPRAADQIPGLAEASTLVRLTCDLGCRPTWEAVRNAVLGPSPAESGLVSSLAGAAAFEKSCPKTNLETPRPVTRGRGSAFGLGQT